MTYGDDRTIETRPLDDEPEPAAETTVLPTGAAVDFDLDSDLPETADIVQAPFAPGPSATAGSGAASHIALPAGCQLLEYRIESVLGSGGFGLTYLARDTHLDCLVAIKEYLPHDLAVRVEGYTVCPRSQEWAEDYQAGLKRFVAEARTLASFRHPNIVRITRFFEAHATAYMVMDYERGESLRDWRRDREAPGEAELMRMFLPLLEGLEVVHQAQVMHRDIKPANIYVRESDGSLVLLDFGSARQTQRTASQGLTTIITPGYAPFEQYHTRGVQGPWSDIYALGGVMYWMISGQRPLEAPARLKDDIMAPARELAGAGYSPHFLAAIDWALRSDEKERPHSVAEFRSALLGQLAPPAAAPGTASPAEVHAPDQAAGDEMSPPAGKKLRLAAWLGSASLALAAAYLWHHMPAKPAGNPASQVSSSAAAEPPSQAVSSEAASEPTGSAAPGRPDAGKAAAKPAAAKPASARGEGVRTKPADGPATAAHAEAEGKRAGDTAPSPRGAKLVLTVVPHGEVILDGKKMGNSPPLTDLAVSAGKHKLEIRSDRLPYVAYYSFDLKPGESKQIWSRFGSD